MDDNLITKEELEQQAAQAEVEEVQEDGDEG